MWAEILSENRSEVLKGLRALISQLEVAAGALENLSAVGEKQSQGCSLS
jgi:hypothetical protein